MAEDMLGPYPMDKKNKKLLAQQKNQLDGTFCKPWT